MNILLVNLPSVPFDVLDSAFQNNEEPEVHFSPDIPLGLLYLGSYARKYASREFDIKFLDINMELYKIFISRKKSEHIQTGKYVLDHLKTIIFRAVDGYNPSLVGINILFATVYQLGNIVSQIFREYCTESFIVAGGVQATNSYQHLLNKGCFNSVILGEGEIPFTKLVNMFEPGKNDYPIHGMILNKNNSQVDMDTKSEIIMDIDSIPFPNYDFLDDKDIDTYLTKLGSARGMNNIRALPIITTRGCPKLCTFCASHTVHGRTIRARSLNNIYDEIEFIKTRFQINTLLIYDDLFNYNKQRTIDFCEEAIKRKWDLDIEFTSGLGMWALDEIVIDKLVKAGASVINLPIESGSPYVQKHIIKKNLNLEYCHTLAEAISRYPEVQRRAFYVLGLPGEQKEHIRETMEYAKSLNVDWSNFYMAMPLPGSNIFEEWVSLGYIDRDNYYDDFSVDYFSRSFDTQEFSKTELTNIVSDLNVMTNYIHNKNIENKNYNKFLPLLYKIVENYPFQIIARYCLYKCLIGLKKNDEANKQLQSIIYWIKNDKKSKTYFCRYKTFIGLPEIIDL